MRTIIIFLIFFGLTTPIDSYAISITPVKFSWGIDEKNNPSDMIVGNKTKIKSLPIYITFMVIGTEYDWPDLENDGTLELKIEFRMDGRVKANAEIGINPTLWIRDKDGLRQELKERDFFDWRTLAIYSKPIGEKLEITIRDGRGNILSPSGFSGLYNPFLLLEK